MTDELYEGINFTGQNNLLIQISFHFSIFRLMINRFMSIIIYVIKVIF